MNKLTGIVVLFLGLIFITGCGENKMEKKATIATSTEQTSQKTSVPTLFIHGYSGGTNSFGHMIQRMEKEKETKKELVLTVTEAGEVQAKGKWSNTLNNPSIQVLFEDNKSHEWNQSEWIKNCLAYLKTTYSIDEVNLVGHSMGGVGALRYLTTYGKEAELPAVRKFVGIAAPFNNFIELPQTETATMVITNGPSVQSDRYADFAAGMGNVSPSMSVLLIAGDVEDGSLGDEAVALTDALSVASLFTANGNPVSEKIFYGTGAQHSQLHENLEVDQLVAEFLWGHN